MTDTRPHIAHIQVDPSRRRAAVRRARRRRQRPAAVGLPRGPDGRPHDPVPRARSERRGSTRSRRCCGPARASRWAPTGASRPPNPLVEIEVAVNRADPAPADPRRRRAVPAGRAAHARARRSTAFTLGSAYVNHLDDDTGSIERRQARRPRRRRPRPVRARRRPDRRRPRPRDVRRRGRRVRGSGPRLSGRGRGCRPDANRRTTARANDVGTFMSRVSGDRAGCGA